MCVIARKDTVFSSNGKEISFLFLRFPHFLTKRSQGIMAIIERILAIIQLILARIFFQSIIYIIKITHSIDKSVVEGMGDSTSNNSVLLDRDQIIIFLAALNEQVFAVDEVGCGDDAVVGQTLFVERQGTALEELAQLAL